MDQIRAAIKFVLGIAVCGERLLWRAPELLAPGVADNPKLFQQLAGTGSGAAAASGCPLAAFAPQPAIAARRLERIEFAWLMMLRTRSAPQGNTARCRFA